MKMRDEDERWRWKMKMRDEDEKKDEDERKDQDEKKTNASSTKCNILDAFNHCTLHKQYTLFAFHTRFLHFTHVLCISYTLFTRFTFHMIMRTNAFFSLIFSSFLMNLNHQWLRITSALKLSVLSRRSLRMRIVYSRTSISWEYLS